ncbi:MAG: DUF1549 and DUF1553 domain-containing protein [Gemmatales bacterium]
MLYSLWFVSLLCLVVASWSAPVGEPAEKPVTFERDIVPVLTKLGCNAGACHGKARGQNGFALSLLAYDADFDYAAITQEGRGRRVFPANPEQSLLLRKPSGELPHGGGKKLPKGSDAYRMIARWIASGLPRTPATAPQLQRIAVTPAEKLMKPGMKQKLTVTAHYSDGSSEEVTRMTTFQSNESVYAAVSDLGIIQAGTLPGEAAIMARYQNHFAVCNVLIPLPTQPEASLFAKLPRNNFIDGLVWDKLQQLGIPPASAADETTLLRRTYLDIIGRLPTPDEVRTYLQDKSSDKRTKLIDALLSRPEYADYWANKWADLIRPNPYRVGIKATLNLDGWLRDAFRHNMPYDQMVREIITAQGSSFHNGAMVVFRDRREPDEITTIVSQLFLGVRLECAKCHHHPFEVWSQHDFYSFAAFFGRLTHKGAGISTPISGGEETVFTKPAGEVKHPVTGKVLKPTPLLGQPMDIPIEQDPREVLAKWMTSPTNPFFAKVMVNRVWADLMGRGIVEPIDDMRATNPPTNAKLLDALADDFKKNGYDIKKLIRTITTSYVYSLSSVPRPESVGDSRNYSRHYRQRLRAEVLLDATSDITGVPEAFDAMPTGSRAMQLWTVRVPSMFLDSFSRQDPNQDPPCERTTETSVVQALHLMNAKNLHKKISSDDGRAASLSKSKKTAGEIVDELYLLVYTRLPHDSERKMALQWFEKPGVDRRLVIEDLLWAMLNTPEFVLKD